MKLPETPKDFEKLMENVDFTRVMQILIPILQPVIIGGLWLGLSKLDSRASALSALITICEPIPTMDLNLPPPVVLASMYHSVDELADIVEEVIQALRELDLPNTEEIVEKVKEEILPEKLDPQIVLSDFQDCVNGYERDTPALLKSKTTKGLYIQGCLLRKGYAQKAIKEYIRKALD
tara:strand:- start:399 stop:932 length:534 start_codon:yes stop_codon:yes gene_type:complete